MKKKNLLTKNNIQKKYLNNTFVKKYNNEYKKIISEINLEINDPKKTTSNVFIICGTNPPRGSSVKLPFIDLLPGSLM